VRLSQLLDEKRHDAAAVFVRRIPFEIDMPGALDRPKRFRFSPALEHRDSLGDRRAVIVRPGRHQQRRSHFGDMIDRAEIGRTEAENGRQQQLE